MTIDRVILENFLTYENLDYEIPKKPLLVQGRNLTEDDQESNGSGKSGIFTAIEFCITASNSRDVRDSELIMFGYDESNIQLYASCKVRKEALHISWKIKLKGSNQLVLKRKASNSDKWIDVSFSNVNDGKKYIMEWFAIEKEDLFNYYIINKTRFKSFFKSSNREKVELINRFSDISIIDGLEDIEDRELLQIKTNIEKELSESEGGIKAIQDAIEEEENRDLKKEAEEKKEEIREEIQSLEDEIEEYKEEIIEIEKLLSLSQPAVKKIEIKIEEVKKDKLAIAEVRIEYLSQIRTSEQELDRVNKEFESFKTTDFNSSRQSEKEALTKLNIELKEALAKKGISESQEKKAREILNEIDLLLAGIITCPKCSHEFLKDENVDLVEQREKRKKVGLIRETITSSIKVISDRIDEIKSEVEAIDIRLSKITEKEELESKDKQALQEVVNKANNKVLFNKKKLGELKDEEKELDDEIDELKKDIQAIKDKDIQYAKDIKNIEVNIETTKKQITVTKNSIKNVKTDSNKEQLESLNKRLEELKSNRLAIIQNFDTISDKINKNNQWVLNFKQFRMFLANQSLETIEFHCNRYLNEMKSDLQVKMEGYKLLADGQIRDEITAKIIRDNERSFSSFSGGEQGRLLFATILANRYMIDKSHKYGGLDFLSIDEVFEGVDAIGLKHLIEAAKLLDIAVMIITHVTDKETSEDILLIEKVNGISQIKN